MTQSEVGKAITVDVSYEDQQGTTELVTSSYSGETLTHSVTVATGKKYNGGGSTGNVYFIDGIANPAQQFIRGNTYVFDQSDASNATHPLKFMRTDGAAYDVGVSSTGVAGTEGAKVTFVVPDDAPADLVYYCEIHGASMGGAVTTSPPMVVSNVNDAPVIDINSTLNITEDQPSEELSYGATDLDDDNLSYEFSAPTKGSISTRTLALIRILHSQTQMVATSLHLRSVMGQLPLLKRWLLISLLSMMPQLFQSIRTCRLMKTLTSKIFRTQRMT